MLSNISHRGLHTNKIAQLCQASVPNDCVTSVIALLKIPYANGCPRLNTLCVFECEQSPIVMSSASGSLTRPRQA